MENLLKFIGDFALDPHLYYVISGYEIQWLRDGDKWRFRLHGDEPWIYTTHQDLEPALRQVGIDVVMLEALVRESALNQAVYANLVLEKAVELFGEDAVVDQIVQTKLFTEQVASMAKELLSPRPPLRLV
jgi:hypothetical protein